MPTKKSNVIKWRDGWITPRQARAIKRIEEQSNYGYGYRGKTVREASSFITEYQEAIQAMNDYDNLYNCGYETHGQWQD